MFKNVPLRIPGNFFVTSGIGQSSLENHAGSFHLCLEDCGIEHLNIVTYSSIIPKYSKQIRRPRKNKFETGMVMPCIMARCDGSEGQTCTAGIAFARLYNKKTKEKESYIVVEIAGAYSDDEIRWRLKKSLDEVYNHGFSHFKMGKPKIHIRSFIPQLRFGTVMIALCFVNYLEKETKEK